MTYWKKKLLIEWLFKIIIVVVTTGTFGFGCWFVWPRSLELPVMFLIAFWTWCVLIVLSRPLVAAQMWLLRPKPIRTWEL